MFHIIARKYTGLNNCSQAIMLKVCTILLVFISLVASLIHAEVSLRSRACCSKTKEELNAMRSISSKCPLENEFYESRNNTCFYCPEGQCSIFPRNQGTVCMCPEHFLSNEKIMSDVSPFETCSFSHGVGWPQSIHEYSELLDSCYAPSGPQSSVSTESGSKKSGSKLNVGAVAGLSVTIIVFSFLAAVFAKKYFVEKDSSQVVNV